MNRLFESCFLVATALLTGLSPVKSLAANSTQYVVSNDDAPFPFPTGVSFYTIGANGVPVYQKQVVTGTFGIGGGYFGANRIKVLNTASQQCVFSSEAGNGNIVGISIATLSVAGVTTGSETDAGTSNGIGLAANSNFLYASFTDSNTIGTFQIQPGCSLTFLNDVVVSGFQGAVINGMALHGNMMIVTYTNGSIESFDISGGTPVSNGDKQFSTATSKTQGSTFPSSIDITSDGHFAIFGDTSTLNVIEISDISSGKLAKTRIFRSPFSISSSNIILSPDETILYVVNTQGDSVSALFFNKTTGQLTNGCTSGPIAGQSVNWSYLSGPALISQTGNGGGVYVSEFGSQSGIATVTYTASGGKCTLQEAAKSPTTDFNSPGLLSIGTFPPRSF
jgi:6-phosphogluconolactonase (cycloisomerase 2 family)